MDDIKPTNEPPAWPQKGISRFIFIGIGLLAFTLGTIGWVMPFVPTTPLYLLTAFCFGKSSRRLHMWFLSTRLYKRHLESYVQRRTMTVSTKVSAIVSITVFMGVSFFLMSAVPVGRVVLAVVWVLHLLYFLFRVKTAGK